MPSNIIPKEDLAAYQRWHLLGIDDSSGGPVAGTRSGREQNSAVSLPTAATELEHDHSQSLQDGFKSGHEEGYKLGYQVGLKAGEADAQHLAELAEALDTELLRQDELLSRELLALALAVAKQMVRTALKTKENLVLDVLREAMNSLPRLTEHLRIMVHPDDLQAVNSFLASDHGHLTAWAVADEHLERGGFRIETSHSEVDGELPARWQEIVDCLGADDAWLD